MRRNICIRWRRISEPAPFCHIGKMPLSHFFESEEIKLNYGMKNIKLIEVPSEIGAGTRGASLGVEAIKIAALDFMSNFFIHFPSEKIPVENKLLYEPIESPYAKRIKGIISMYE